ncbi:MAG: hypothetical protein AB3N20_02350 [Rhizobiaceae bacterium]
MFKKTIENTAAALIVGGLVATTMAAPALARDGGGPRITQIDIQEACRKANCANRKTKKETHAATEDTSQGRPNPGSGNPLPQDTSR